MRLVPLYSACTHDTYTYISAHSIWSNDLFIFLASFSSSSSSSSHVPCPSVRMHVELGGGRRGKDLGNWS